MVYVYMCTGMAEGQKLLDVFIALHIVYEARSFSSKLAQRIPSLPSKHRDYRWATTSTWHLKWLLET